MPETIRVVTYNIQRGLSAVKRREILQQIVLVLEVLKADVVCLQEVWQEYGLNEHQLEALCRAGWRHRLWRPNAVFPTGSQGNAVLSRFAVTSWRHVDISVRGHEPRGLLHVDLALPDGGPPLAVLCAHFGLRAAERRQQALWLRRHVEQLPEATPLVLAGDFNDWRGRPGAILAGAPGFQEALQSTTGRFGRTFPSFAPLLPLDRVYFRGLRLVTARVVRRLEPHLSLSDHLPIEAVFEMPGAAARPQTEAMAESR